MKAKNVLLSGILGVALAGVVLTGCHKDSTAPTSTPNNNSSGNADYSAAEDESNASDAMNDSKTISDAAAQGTASSKYGPVHNVSAIYSSHCVVSWAKDTSSNYDTLYVNFGASPVQCNDLRWRQGEIIVYWARNTGSLLQSYFDSGSTITMTFKNYAAGNSQYNMIGVTGTRAWTNTGKNALLQQNWKFVANLTLTYYSNNETATWNSTRTNTLVEVNSVYYYEITGSAAGTNRKGNPYSLTITNPLYVTALPWWLGGCAWIEAGTIYVTLVNNQNANISIDFGNVGTCDDVAVATINNTNHTIYMW